MKLFLSLSLLLITSVAFSENLATFSGIKVGMRDQRIEQQAIIVANKAAGQRHWPEDYYKAIIISHSWDERLDESGTPKERAIHVELLAKMPDGRCAMTDFTFIQKILEPEHTYSDKLTYRHAGNLVYVECED